jgi:N-glycosidase YbiA
MHDTVDSLWWSPGRCSRTARRSEPLPTLLRDGGCSTIESFRLLTALTNPGLANAKQQVDRSAAWHDVRTPHDRHHESPGDGLLQGHVEDKDGRVIKFYGAQSGPYGCFSNFSPHGFELDGAWWPTTEHYFQAQKFVGTPYVEEIRRAASPTVAKRMGRSRSQPLRPDWEQVKDDAMRRAVLRKFEAHADIRAVLLSTGDQPIVEDAPRDYYWGSGAKGTGRNMLGRILMEVRHALRRAEPCPITEF